MKDLLKIFTKFGFAREMRKIIRMTEDDPELQEKLKQLQKSHKEVERKMKLLCKRFPNNKLCTGGGTSELVDVKF